MRTKLWLRWEVLTALLLVGAVVLLYSGRGAATNHSHFIVLDPGHGGSDPGTHAHGVDEKTITLAVAKLLAPMLEHHHVRVVLTREWDKYVGLDRRVAIANQPGNLLLVSLHCDDYVNKHMDGFTVLYAQQASQDSHTAARLLAAGLRSEGFTCHDVRMDTRRLEVLDQTTGPAVLVEMGFMSNPENFRYLTSPLGQKRLALGLARGLMAYWQHTQ